MISNGKIINYVKLIEINLNKFKLYLHIYICIFVESWISRVILYKISKNLSTASVVWGIKLILIQISLN